ncbi:uncharacterized protein LOC119644385 [Glossina fuscipes]|uniref:Uncharacterized protein LOC119644385 n=1 Tax=Glossina fuscipes TaxID=7396 RepID=A0A9C5ZMX9_9MUSC|nr:uncharacterized protein LOC119644385 [Glossina fuscipes]
MTQKQLQILFISIGICLLLFISSVSSQEKWSRQISEATESGVTNDNYDWIPLPQSADNSSRDRSSNGRVLTYSQSFPPDGHFADLSRAINNAAVSSKSSPFDFSYAPFRSLSNSPQTQSLRQQPSPLSKANNLQPQEPTSQSFFKFEMPLGNANNRPANIASGVNTGYNIQHAFGGGGQATLFNSPLFNQQPIFPPEFHPLPQKPTAQSLQRRPSHHQNFVEDPISLNNFFKDTKPTQSPLQSVTPQVFPVEPQPPEQSVLQLSKPSTFQFNPLPTAPVHSVPSSVPPVGLNNQQADVQYLYVPFESLYNQQQPVQQTYSQQPQSYDVPAKYNNNPVFTTVNPFHINQFYTPEPVIPSQPRRPNVYTTSTTTTTTSTTTTTQRPRTTTRKPTNVYENYLKSQTTTLKPKPKAHQPPLAMFLVRTSSRLSESQVVDTLKNARSIAVVDAPNSNTPAIFVGPGGMPTPNGYTKFELPYLSQLQGAQNLNDVPFYVAPLSYRTPPGFSKILLPEPHVGSIVINLARASPPAPPPPPPPPRVQNQPQMQPVSPVHSNIYYSFPQQNLLDEYTSSTSRPKTTSQRTKIPNRGNKVSYYSVVSFSSDVLLVIFWEKILPKWGPPQSNNNEQQLVYNQHPNNPYAQFNPMPNQISDIKYFKLPVSRPSTTSSTSTSTTTSSTTTSTTPAPQTYFIYNTSPEVEYHSTRGHLNPQNNQVVQEQYKPALTTSPPQTPQPQNNYDYQNNQNIQQQYDPPLTTLPQYQSTRDQFNNQIAQEERKPHLSAEIPQTPPPPRYSQYEISDSSNTQSNQVEQNEYKPRLTTPPSPVGSITPEEEYRMKQYFRQQDAFRNRPKIIPTTTPAYEQEHYTPQNFEYAATQRPPSTTTTTTTKRPRITFYSPTSAPEINDQFSTLAQTSDQNNYNIPANHRPAYNQNEVSDGPVEYDPNPYQLPSELPPLTPNLPGLVNNLQEKGKQNNVEQNAPTSSEPTRPTRRPFNRLRKPVATKISSSVSYSETENTNRRPANRLRRPYGTKASAYINTEDTAATSTTTTRRPSASRKPLIRNPNRIRYQPTPEERESLRLKPKKRYKGSAKKQESEDLDYQRDVLKQNYPIFRPSTRRTTTTPEPLTSYSEITTEVPASESQQIYTVTPGNNIDNDNEQNFPAGLLEPMQIAQQYNHYTNNYGPGYFPNQEDLNPTESIYKNEINPAYATTTQDYTTTFRTTTTTAKTTEAPPEETTLTTTRRSPFIRRNYPRIRTTTETPTTTTQAEEERYLIRPRLPPRKVVRVRARTRRPLHPASSTPSTEEENEQGEESKQTYRKTNRYNQGSTDNEPPRRRYKTRFQLEAQESQWSPAVKVVSSSNFKPINPKEYPVNKHKFENEPDIVTVDPKEENENYEIKVSANYGSKSGINTHGLRGPSLRPEKSFAELLEEVMGKAPGEKLTEAKSNDESADGSIFESQRNSIADRIYPNRRGKWKKVRVSLAPSNNESFELAESQNLGSQLINSIPTSGKPITVVDLNKDLKITTPITATVDINRVTTMINTTPISVQAKVEEKSEYSSQTTEKAENFTMEPTILAKETTTTENLSEIVGQEEIATRRMDEDSKEEDLEIQPSLFSEVKKQLHELFSIEEESDDSAVTAALTAVSKRRQEYTHIKRVKPETTVAPTTEIPNFNKPMTPEERQAFHKQLMEHVIYATSQPAIEQTSEAEICYRGRCIKSDDIPANHKIN